MKIIQTFDRFSSLIYESRACIVLHRFGHYVYILTPNAKQKSIFHEIIFIILCVNFSDFYSKAISLLTFAWLSSRNSSL